MQEQTMKTQLLNDYTRCRKAGPYHQATATQALRFARTLEQWREAERADLVRLKADYEQENYFDVFGKPDDEREYKSLCDTIDRLGCYVVYSEVNQGSESEGDDWQHCDSIGMCVYRNPLDPFENCYVVDLMRAALDKIPQPGNVDELCTSLDT